MSRRIAAIVNPASGRRRTDSRVRAIAEAVRAGGGAFEIHETQGPGEATELAAGLDGRMDAILAVGGDGTVCEIANGLGAHGRPIAILSTGTENLLARELNMPTDPPALADLLLHGRATPHDAGEMNGRRFLAVAGVGFDGLCAHRMAALRTGHITHLDYFRPIWRSLLDYDFPEFRVSLDGQEDFCGRGFVIVGIIRRYSLGLRIAARAVPDDGLMDVCMFRCDSKLGLLAHASRVLAGKHLHHRDVAYAQCRRVRFDCELPIAIHVDGEPGGFTPADCSVLPHAVRFLSMP